MEDKDKTKKEFIQELSKLRQQVTELETLKTQQEQKEKKIEHLTNVFYAIRKVNQLITREKNRDKLLKGICDSLTLRRGYFNAWVVLLSDSGELVRAIESGLGKNFLPMREQLNAGKLTLCAQKALSQPDPVITKDPVSTCTDCPLSAHYGRRGAMTMRLEHRGRIYGFLVTSIPVDFIADKEECSLFKEIAGDIAFALYSLEMEKERKKTEEKLIEKTEQQNILLSLIPALVYFKDTESILA